MKPGRGRAGTQLSVPQQVASGKAFLDIGASLLPPCDLCIEAIAKSRLAKIQIDPGKLIRSVAANENQILEWRLLQEPQLPSWLCYKNFGQDLRMSYPFPPRSPPS